LGASIQTRPSLKIQKIRREFLCFAGAPQGAPGAVVLLLVRMFVKVGSDFNQKVPQNTERSEHILPRGWDLNGRGSGNGSSPWRKAANERSE
ncbi:MAG: hypothetical protein U1A28_00785, partial [Patescibacteria group bacterium]|nr:hypothetical protein [Patescibacteria group bacterium]